MKNEIKQSIGHQFYRYFNKRRNLWNPIYNEINLYKNEFANIKKISINQLDEEIDLYFNDILKA